MVDTRNKALFMVNRERDRQETLWGEQNHPPQFWTGILMEEVGEYAEAVNETVLPGLLTNPTAGGYGNMLKELTQVAAVAVNAMECLLRQEDTFPCEHRIECVEGPTCGAHMAEGRAFACRIHSQEQYNALKYKCDYTPPIGK